MRTIALILLIATLTSCKDYTCRCSVLFKTTSGNFNVASSEETYKSSSKKKANNKCLQIQAVEKDKDTTASCSLL